MKNTLTKFMSNLQQLGGKIEQSYYNIAEVYPESDILQFIDEHKTSSAIPDPFQVQHYQVSEDLEIVKQQLASKQIRQELEQDNQKPEEKVKQIIYNLIVE